MPGRVDDPDRDRADPEHLAVLERLKWVLGRGERMDRDRDVVLEREAAMAREVVCVRVRLEHPDDSDAFVLGRREVLLDRKGRVDDDRFTGGDVADEIGAAAEIAVDELPEEHEIERTSEGSSSDRYAAQR